MWASGARSPLAPSEPLAGTQGVTPALSMSISVCATTGRTPEWPLASMLARMVIMARTISPGSGSPTPQTHSRIRLRDSCRASSALICRLAREPKPVLTP